MALLIDKAMKTNYYFPTFPHPFSVFLHLCEFSDLNLSNPDISNETKRLKVVDVQIPTSIPQTSSKLGRENKKSFLLITKNEESLKCIRQLNQLPICTCNVRRCSLRITWLDNADPFLKIRPKSSRLTILNF